jgi:hypothetical protein
VGEKGPVGEIEHPDVFERVDRSGQLLAVLRVASVHSYVSDTTLPLLDNIYGSDVAFRFADDRKDLPQNPRLVRVLDPEGYTVTGARSRSHGL